MTRARLSAWHTAVFSALGVGSLVNCGGVSTSSDDPNGSEAGNTGVPTTGGAGGTAGSGPGGPPSCVDPTPVVIVGSSGPLATGFVTCHGGWTHREQQVNCPSLLPRAAGVGAVESGCTSDADCTEHSEGWCYRTDPNPSICGAPSGRFVGRCSYGCVRDDDCGSGMICVCGEWTGQCAPSDCTTDADCGGLLCVSSNEGFGCQRASDECMLSADCSGGYCTNARTCEPLAGTGGSQATGGAGGTCGRPFLVLGEPRLARVSHRAGHWSRGTQPDVRHLTRAERARLTEHWTAIACMEHASVAAFARFTLELVSLGAPAELVEGAQRAMGDEIEHARLCFGLASAYGERAVGPGPLSVEGALDGRSFEDIVLTAMLEACVGETLAAVEAEDAAERATDPEVRVVLARIACDEARHAELGFRFLAWAADRAEPRVRERIARAFDSAVRTELAACDTPVSVDDVGLARHGMPSPAERRAVRELALREILAPAARSLAARAGVASTSSFEPALA